MTKLVQYVKDMKITKYVVLMILGLVVTGAAQAELDVVEGDRLCVLRWDDQTGVLEKSFMSNIGFKPVLNFEEPGIFQDKGLPMKVYYYRLRTTKGFSPEKSCVPGKST